MYIVNYIDGNYDGRGNFCGVFSTEENAKKYISRYDARDRAGFDIDEYEIDDQL